MTPLPRAKETPNSTSGEGRSAKSGPALPSSAASVASADGRRDSIGGIRAIGSGLVIVVAGFLGVIVFPNLILTGTFFSSRDVRVLVATAVAVGWVVLMAWLLRRLQRQGLI